MIINGRVISIIKNRDRIFREEKIRIVVIVEDYSNSLVMLHQAQ